MALRAASRGHDLSDEIGDSPPTVENQLAAGPAGKGIVPPPGGLGEYRARGKSLCAVLAGTIEI